MTLFDSSYIGKTVSFNTRVPGVLGTSFANVRVDALLDHRTASLFRDAAATHANVYPTVHAIDPTVPDDYTKYLYIKFTDSNGVEDCLGIPWIDPGSVVEINSVALNAYMTGPGVTLDRINDIKNALLSIGITNVVISPVLYLFICVSLQWHRLLGIC